jgi:hypothetical protein
VHCSNPNPTTSSTSTSISTSIPSSKLIPAGEFELEEKKRKKVAVLPVVAVPLDSKTLNSTEERSDEFELQMLKPSSKLKDTNGKVREHYRLQNLKILEVCPSLPVCVS